MNSLHKSAVCTLALAAFAIGGTLIAPPAKTAASPGALRTVTTSDGTASVGLADGWQLIKGANGYVGVTGPNGDQINLGAIIVAKNAPAGSGVGNAVLALPFGAGLRNKLTTILQLGAGKQGRPVPQVTYVSQTRMRLPMCSRFLGWTAGSQSRKFEAILCSLRPDYLGYYKNLVFLAHVPANRVAQDRPMVERIVSSYRVTPGMFKKMLSAYTAPPPRPSAGVRAAMAGMAPYQDPTNSDCFDYNVIRESPPWEVPIHCGGTQPE